MAADFGPWVGAVIVAFLVIANLIGSLRRGAQKPTQSADLAQRSSDLSSKSLEPAQAVDVNDEVLAQIQAARRAAATLTVSATRAAAQRSAPAVVTSAGQALAATLENVLDARASHDAAGGLPLPVAHRHGLQGLPAALHAPGGLAFAVLSATIIGPCTALKTAPQEPGGW